MWDFSIRTRPHTCEHSNGLRWVGCQKSSFISKGSVAIGVWQPFSGPNTKTLRCDQTHCFAKYGKILRHTNIGSSDWGDIILATNNHWSFSNTFIIQRVPCSQVELDLYSSLNHIHSHCDLGARSALLYTITNSQILPLFQDWHLGQKRADDVQKKDRAFLILRSKPFDNEHMKQLVFWYWLTKLWAGQLYNAHKAPTQAHEGQWQATWNQALIKFWQLISEIERKSHLIKTAEIFRFPFGTQPTNQPTGLVQLEPGFATQHKYEQVCVTLSIWGKQITKWLHFWLDESITSYSEAINYLGLFHLYQDNRAATERQKPAAIALHHRPPRRQHWQQ